MRKVFLSRSGCRSATDLRARIAVVASRPQSVLALDAAEGPSSDAEFATGQTFVIDGGEMFRATYDFTIEQYEAIKKTL